ncbi:MAG: Mur ligase family protein [Gammaproteobacteria bacterium]|nr:Mur ligase family protein [Gammaproteobacteria bacterium]
MHFRSIDLTLDRVRRVAHVLGLPASARYVTVAGTNGKGSSVAFLESIYRAAGYRTGAYTSPHLVRYNERVRVDGAPLDDEPLIDAFAAVEAARASIPLTYFEFGTSAALHALRKFPLDVVILEVGMGGRLDAVNVVDADAALVTSVGLDHQQWLGATREKIAGEKAGVLRHGGRAVTSDEHPPATLLRVAEARRCNLWCLGRDFTAAVRGRTWDWLWCGAPAAAVAGVTGIALPEQGSAPVEQRRRRRGGGAAVRERVASRRPRYRRRHRLGTRARQAAAGERGAADGARRVSQHRRTGRPRRLARPPPGVRAAPGRIFHAGRQGHCRFAASRCAPYRPLVPRPAGQPRGGGPGHADGSGRIRVRCAGGRRPEYR